MTTVTRPTTVESIPQSTIDAIAVVGRIVTHRDQQYRVHSVEGKDFYAFQSANGGVTADLGMTTVSWFPETVATLTPMDAHHLDGRNIEVPISTLTRGVCLIKGGDSVWH